MLQGLDKQVYWNSRFASRGLLVIIIDSMDKTKFAWPQFSFAKQPHNVGDLVQPHIGFTIAMAHSYCIDMYTAPKELNHGANAFLESLCRTMDHMQQICQQRHRQKARLFLSVNLMFLIIGHTHKDIDRCSV